LVVGDSTLDILAGVLAGSIAIGCTWGVASEQQLLEAGADCTHDNVSQLAECLLERVSAQ
jgi:phosphoglycolate phosphatase-like HAD superfamily hydrolase